MQLFLKLLAGAAGTALAVWLVPGITLESTSMTDKIITLLVVAAILGVVNAVVKPFAQVVGFCFVVLTLGLFLLVINALMLMLVSWVSAQFSLGFHVDGFWPAFFGAIIISIASAVVGGLLGVEKE